MGKLTQIRTLKAPWSQTTPLILTRGNLATKKRKQTVDIPQVIAQRIITQSKDETWITKVDQYGSQLDGKKITCVVELIPFYKQWLFFNW